MTTRKEPYEIPLNEYQFMRMVEEDERVGGLTRLNPAFTKEVDVTYEKSIKTALAQKKQIPETILEEWQAWEAGSPLETAKAVQPTVKINNRFLEAAKVYKKLQDFLTVRIAIAHMKPAEAEKVAALLNSEDGAELIIQNSADKVLLFYAAVSLTHDNKPGALNEYPVSKKVRSAARCAAVLAIIGNDGFRRKSQNKPPGNGPRSPFLKCPRVFVPPISPLN